MSVDPGVIDANVLTYAMNADDSRHAASCSLLETAREPSETLYVTSQILCEFYSIITNARRFTNACSAAEGLRILSVLLNTNPPLRLTMLPYYLVQQIWLDTSVAGVIGCAAAK